LKYLVATVFISGVEFGARMITIDGKQIKLQIWDTVSTGNIQICYICSLKACRVKYIKRV